MSRTLIASLAVGALLTLSTGAFAQTMLQGKTVSEADLPRVQAQCDTLAAAHANELNKSASPDANTAGTTSDSSSTNDTPPDAALVTSVDLTTLTYEDCKAAGLSK